ncbi:MAG: carboxypeptidase-like regulatory domain-containing protein [Planctomycetota bacterium]
MKRLIHAAAAFALLFAGSFASAADVSEHQWVRLSEDGKISGRVVVPRSEGISAARGAKVSLISQDGKYAASPVMSDKTGRFELSSIQPGVYTLMIQGDSAFACCAMHVVNSNVPIRSEIEIAAGAVEASVAQSAMVRYLTKTDVSGIEFDPAVNPLATDRAMSGELLRVSQFEGGLRGRLTKAGFGESLGSANSNVIVYADGVEVSRTVTDENGDFVVSELMPGSYSVMGSGADGFGLMGLELIDPLTLQTVSSDAPKSETLVAMQPPATPDSFVMQVAPLPGPINVIDDRLIEERVVGIPLDGGPGTFIDGGVAGPMGGGGFGGGGGAIGGGGSLRGIGLLGGAGAAIAIALADDDDNLIAPPPASPIIPANN